MARGPGIERTLGWPGLERQANTSDHREDRVAARVDLTLDCANPTRLAEFWKLALGYEDEPPPAPVATGQEPLEQLDLADDPADDGAWLRDPDGTGPRLFLQQVLEPRRAKNRLHMDVRVTGDGEPEQRWATVTDTVDRLVAAGATVLLEFRGHHVVMADPEGNEFCVC
jgi:hypothetical protein